MSNSPSSKGDNGQKDGSDPTASTVRRGAVSVKDPGEYWDLKPHTNKKDNLLQYKSHKKSKK
jgi:hypothetical protein